MAFEKRMAQIALKKKRIWLKEALVGSVLCFVLFQTAALASELARQAQLEAPEKLTIEVLTVQESKKGMFLAAGVDKEVELEARVIKVNESHSGVRPGQHIVIRYDKPSMVTTELNPPVTPTPRTQVDAFLAKHGDLFYIYAYQYSFSPLTDAQEKVVAERRREVVEKAKESQEKVVEMPEVVTEPAAVEQKMAVVETPNAENAETSPSDAPEKEKIEEVEMAEPVSLSGSEADRLRENEQIRIRLNAEMIAQNEARRRRMAAKEDGLQAREKVESELMRRRRLSVTPDEYTDRYRVDNNDQNRSDREKILLEEVESAPPVAPKAVEIEVEKKAEPVESVPPVAPKAVEIEVEKKAEPVESVPPVAPKAVEMEESLEFREVEMAPKPSIKDNQPVKLKTPAQMQAAADLFKNDPRGLLYKKYFDMVQNGEEMFIQGNLEKARDLFRAAFYGLERMRAEHPDFHPEVVEFRLKDCARRLKEVEEAFAQKKAR